MKAGHSGRARLVTDAPIVISAVPPDQRAALAWTLRQTNTGAFIGALEWQRSALRNVASASAIACGAEQFQI